MIGNPQCPICGLYELNDGSEDTLWTCECDEQALDCDKCGAGIDDNELYYQGDGKILCAKCCPGEKIGERQ